MLTPRTTTMSCWNGASGCRIGDSVNWVEIAGDVADGVATDGLIAVGRQFSGMVPHGLKNTPKRLGGVTADCARRLCGSIISSQGSATPTPKAPFSSVRREI